MRSRLMVVVVALVVASGLFRMFVSTPPAEAQGVTPQLIAGYLGRTGLAWKRDDKEPNTFRVNKTSGLKRASRVEIVVTNIPDKNLVTVRSFPQINGKWLSLSQVTDKQGLMNDMLKRNATAFGAYFLDTEGDFGFRFIFTTESGLGYTAFKTVLDEHLRIADEHIVALYQKYR